MLSQLQSSYQRMEQSLQRLTDSIAAYNPSTSAADDLLAADDALSEDLETLVQHQRNVLRIEELKRIAQENDERIRGHFTAVAELRKELCAIPSTNTSPVTRDVSVDELLSYAQYISRTTVPPTFRKKDAQFEPTDPAPVTNGIATPPPGSQEEPDSNPPYIKSSAIATGALSEPEKVMLNPLPTLPFAPWPEQLVIANGALGEIQRMVEAGRDPASVLSPEERGEAERKRKEEEEREKLEEAERERRRQSMFDTVGAGRGRERVEESDVFDPDA